MKDNLTDITFVLDRSGSMGNVRMDTIGGFNAFVKSQKEAPGEASMTLVQFDDAYEINYTAKPVAEVIDLNESTFVPRGWTALVDAIGKTIVTTGERLGKMDEADRPGKVIFVIQTDGGENASKEFTKDKIGEMIKTQTETYNWDFVFLGANQDAIQTGAGLGILRGNSMTYASNAIGSQAVYSSVADSMTSYRGGDMSKKSQFFSEDDRTAQVDAGAIS